MNLHIQLITLEETPERERNAVKELNGISHTVHRFKKMSPGWKGCVDSHLQVYRKNISSETIFICEDNILFTNEPQSKYANLLKFMKTCPNWGIIFVGGYIARPWGYCKETKYPQVYETRGNNHGTVSYIIHSRLFKEILNVNAMSPISKPIDCFLSQYTNYIYNPLMFYHSHTSKSTINSYLDPLRKVWFHPKMMKLHHLIFFNRMWLYILLVIISGGLWWVLRRRRRVASIKSQFLDDVM